ncbi:PII family protein [Virgibacillus dakarensis]|uniref:P-II family nitrogen regulator n=1 Tax=Virgibacillus dakarensis TaxID=1917889 RepID=UPI000B452D9B|nr:P-II family nitrogen regulator [Virgibacillus dakarensis]MBT2215750.1 PII family protein [Virgibacillus dakarensis]MTW86162.1 PII family protein [Virgibacillus dakarensis]
MAMTKPGQKLIVTIVRKEKAKKVIHASKSAGAKGGTTLIGNGIRLNEKLRILGIPIEREREIILTLVSNKIFPEVMNAIIDSVKLNQPRQGIGFVIDTKHVTGICHMMGLEMESEDMDKEGVTSTMEEQNVLYDLIVTIVNKGDSENVVDATKKAGAEGGTILNGRGTGIHEQAKLFNILIEPEKEVVLTLISRDKTSNVLKTIEKDAELNKPGKGISFVLEVEKTVGINHILNELVNKKLNE